MKMDPWTITLTKLNSKWINELNVRLETIKLLEENLWKKLLGIGLGNDFFFLYDTQSINNKSRNQQAGLHQTKKFSVWKKKQSTELKVNLKNGRKCLQTIYLG